MRYLRKLAHLGMIAFSMLAPCTQVAGADLFKVLHDYPYRQYEIDCPIALECEVEFEAGVRITNGFNASIQDWDSHVAYSGHKVTTPHLMLKPYRKGTLTNVVLLTNRGTYHLLLRATNDTNPKYYRFVEDGPDPKPHPRTTPRPSPTPTPLQAVDLRKSCIDFQYSYRIETSLPSDHPAGAAISKDQFPAAYIPQVVCTDGKHTFIQFPLSVETQTDLPIHLALTPEGDTIANETYYAEHSRFILDGVYPDILLEMGSQHSPIRVRIFHSQHFIVPRRHRHAPQPPVPIPIIPPWSHPA